jgi:exodeoxyribonuclease VII large subunit
MAGFLSAQAGDTEQVWTVQGLTRYIRELFEVDFRLQDVMVDGELSNFKQARSGHLYFTLKDAEAQLKCVMWRSRAEMLHFWPEDGDAVRVHGRISVYEAGGVYQLYAEEIEPRGQGGLALAFERLKARLADEGLFDPAHKQPLPRFPRKIGVVTSADAAALRDILHVLARRYPLVQVLIAPTLVQGEGAPPQIVRALQWLDGRSDIDLILLSRGGGSMEDLWAFNDERVARAIYAARHPIISGVGHETDFTIADFVADQRAPTPSAAAELAVPDLAQVRPALADLNVRLQGMMADVLARRRQTVDSLRRALRHLSPRARLDNHRQRVDMLHGRLSQAMARQMEQRADQLAFAQARLHSVSPLATLARGYAIVRDEQGRVIRSVDQAAPGQSLAIQVSDGTIEASVT